MSHQAGGMGRHAVAAAVPALDFAVEDAGAMEFAAAPALRFTLRIEAPAEVAIRSVSLSIQIRIAAAHRSYDVRTRERLVEVFGQPSQWSQSARSLFWTQVAVQVPAFTGAARVEIPVPCTYDFDVATAKYFHGVEEGEIPLEFVFTGSVFYLGEGGLLRTGRISWDREARYRLPIRIWKEMMDHYFPNSAWLRLHRDVFQRLYAYKASRALPTWEAAIEELLALAPGDPHPRRYAPPRLPQAGDGDGG